YSFVGGINKKASLFWEASGKRKRVTTSGYCLLLLEWHEWTSHLLSKHRSRLDTRTSSRRDRALLCSLDETGELFQYSSGIPRSKGLHVSSPSGEFVVAHQQVDRVSVDVNLYLVTVGHQSNRSPVEGFGRHVAHAESVRTAAETAVGDQRAVTTATDALHGARHREHLAHARPGAGSLVADHHHGPWLDLVGHDRGHSVVLAVKDPRGAREGHVVEPGHLDDRTLRGQRAGQDCDAAAIVNGVPHVIDHATI